MNKTACIELCPECPLRTMLPGSASSPGEPLYLKKVGEMAIPKTEISDDGRFASIEIDNVAGPKQAEVAILSEGVDSGPAFWVNQETWNSGEVQQSFEDCNEPTQIRSGFLKLTKHVACSALTDLK